MTSWHPLRWLRRTTRTGPARSSHDTPTPAAVVDELMRAWGADDARRMSVLLAPEVTLTVDTGGVVAGLAGTTTGPGAVAAALVHLGDAHPAPLLERREVNGGPGIALRSGGRVVAVVCISLADGKVDEVWAVVNPDKLSHWNGG